MSLVRVSTIDGMLRGRPPPRADRRGLDAEVARASVMAGLFGGPDGLYRLGRYRLRRTLGEGAHGQVFAGWDPELQREVAIKIVRDLGGDVERFRDRRAREAQALARLSHPNVVEIYDVGIHDDAVFIVMELVDGDDLERWLARTRPGLAEVLTVFAAAGRGLAAAHGVGLVHRDFKPTNVLLGSAGRVKVADFGLAHDEATRTGEEALTATQPGAGTPIYMAPEQHAGAELDARADQYAFCVALWEAVTGSAPFTGTRASALLEAKLAGVGERRPACSHALAAVLRRGLAPDPAQRFRSMHELLDAITRARSRRLAPVMLGGAAIAVAVVALVAAAGGASMPACERDHAPPWDADRRAAILDGFAASGTPGADIQALRVADVLDAYAVRWADARRSACAASDHTRARAALRCLGAAEAELDALTTAFRDPDGAVVGRAWSAAQGLPEPEACLDPSAEALTAASSPEHEAVERRIARARALRRAAELDAALEQAELAVADATALDPHVRVPALYELGMAHEDLQHSRAAEEAHEAAYFLAEANGMASWAAAAAVRLAAVHIERRERAEVDIWLRHAEAALQRSGFPRAHHAAYTSALATHLVEGASWTEALERVGEALALEDDPHHRAMLVFTRARIHEELGDLAAAERDLRDALALEEQVFGAEHPQLLRAVLQLGNVLYLRGRYPEARATVERAQMLAASTYASDSPVMARIAESLGMIAYDLDELDIAWQQHGRALAIRQAALSPDHPEVAYSLFNVALVELQRGDLAAAIPRLDEALRVLEAAFGSEHPRLAHVLSALGSAYAEAGRYDEGIAALRRADVLKTDAPPEVRAETLRHLATALAASGAPATEVDAEAERARILYAAAGEAFAARRAEFEDELARALAERDE